MPRTDVPACCALPTPRIRSLPSHVSSELPWPLLLATCHSAALSCRRWGALAVTSLLLNSWAWNRPAVRDDCHAGASCIAPQQRCVSVAAACLLSWSVHGNGALSGSNQTYSVKQRRLRGAVAVTFLLLSSWA